MTDNPQSRVDNPPPKTPRNYIQWGEKDIDLLLKELEKPGAYQQWKENKSGYSKKVSEQVFNNSMNQDAIKFKIRWLETRFQSWNSQLQDLQPAVLAILREKMLKEFPYYDRFESIYENHSASTTVGTPMATSANTTTSAITTAAATAVPVTHPAVSTSSSTTRAIPMVVQADTDMAALSPSSSSTSSFPQQHSIPAQPQTIPFKRIASNADLSDSNNKRAHTIPQTGSDASSLLQSNRSDTNASEQYLIKKMEYELEFRKMDHEERMQRMKLEQLKLEIELQKLKNHTNNGSSPSF